MTYYFPLTRVFAVAVTVLITLGSLHADPKKKRPDAPPPEAKNQIQFLVRVGADMNETVLAPLPKHFPRDIRPTLIRLRDNLLDEAKDEPVASQATYAVGVQLVNAWLSALEERKSRGGSMGLAAPPNSDLQHSRKTVLHDWADVLTFQRELKDDREFRGKEMQKKKFFHDADINNWRLRTEALRPGLENLFSRFRALRREST